MMGWKRWSLKLVAMVAGGGGEDREDVLVVFVVVRLEEASQVRQNKLLVM